MLHGGEIYDKKIELDFSVNLNPVKCPEAVIDEIKRAAGEVTNYPDISQSRFRTAVAEVETGLSEKNMKFTADNIVGGSGASELLMAIACMVRPKKALLPIPSFYGYEHALSAVGCEVVRYDMAGEDESGKTQFELSERFTDAITEDTDMVILGNPNNPTGRLISEDLLLTVLERCRKMDASLVVDECFYRLSGKREGGASTVSARNFVQEYGNLVVVDAYTKLFSIPGVRVGFAITSAENAERLRRFMPEWNMSVFAEYAGIKCAEITEEGSFIQKTLEVICRERDYLSAQLSGLGITVYPSDTNFILIKSEDELYEKLLKKRILIRDCSNFRGLDHGCFRIAVKDHASNERLINAIRA